MSYSCDLMTAARKTLSMWILQAVILEWVVMPSSRTFSQCRDWTQGSCIAGGFFTIWATKEALFLPYNNAKLAIIMHISPPSWASLLLPQPSPLGPQSAKHWWHSFYNHHELCTPFHLLWGLTARLTPLIQVSAHQRDFSLPSCLKQHYSLFPSSVFFIAFIIWHIKFYLFIICLPTRLLAWER